MAVLIVMWAGAMIALSNLFMRKSIDGGRSVKGFLVFKLSVGGFFAVLLNPCLSGNYTFSAPIAYFGLISGAVLGGMLFFLGKALETGPPGFTFSIASAATVMPSILMALFLGSAEGFPYTLSHGVGSILVLAGLFWAGRGLFEINDWKKWIFFSCFMFFLHVALLTLFQWRAYLLKISYIKEVASFFKAEQIQSQWFLPFMFLGAALIQILIYLKTERRKPDFREFYYGSLGGVINSTGVFFLIWATEIASPLQGAVIFPVYSVVTILLSNLWGQKLYEEKIEWKACYICLLGIAIGTIDWKSLIGFFSI